MNARAGGPSESAAQKLRGFDDYELTLGDVMRGERATKGKSLLDIQRDLKIRAEYLAAIEDCDLKAFETPGFINGYVKAYARYLGMNPDWVFKRFCQESGFSHVTGLEAQIQTRKPADRTRAAWSDPRAHAGNAILARSPISAAPAPGLFQGVEIGAIVSTLVLGALIAGLGYGGWSVLQEIQRVTVAPVETPLTVAAAPDGSIEAAGLGVDNGAPTTAALERLYRPQALETPVLVPRDGPIATLDPSTQGVFADYKPAPDATLSPPPVAMAVAAPGAPVPAGVMVANADPAAPLPALDSPQVVEAAPGAIVLFARQPCWVRVKAEDGTVLLEKILEKGERYVLPATETAPSLRAGNAGSLYFVVNGQTLGPAGPGASVAKKVVLSAESLAQTYTTPDLAADPELASLAALVLRPETPPTTQP
jgi:cytoskeletal protein RodZ